MANVLVVLVSCMVLFLHVTDYVWREPAPSMASNAAFSKTTLHAVACDVACDVACSTIVSSSIQFDYSGRKILRRKTALIRCEILLKKIGLHLFRLIVKIK